MGRAEKQTIIAVLPTTLPELQSCSLKTSDKSQYSFGTCGLPGSPSAVAAVPSSRLELLALIVFWHLSGCMGSSGQMPNLSFW